MPNHSRRQPFPARARRSLCCALAFVLLPSAAVAQQRAVRSLVAADSVLASRASRGIAALAAGATRDVVLLHDNASVIRGRDAMVAALDSLANRTHDRVTWTALRADVSADGTHGYTYGRGSRTVAANGRDSASGIRYAAWWRNDGNVWRVAALLLIDERAGADTSMRWPCASVTPAVSRASKGASDGTREVVAADSAFAARSLVAGPAVAFAEYVATDGISIGGSGIPACGKRAVGAQLEGVSPSDLAWSPIIGDAAASGDLGYTVGTATVQGAHATRFSKYLTIWKRQPDGAWRFVADGGSAAPARQHTLAAH